MRLWRRRRSCGIAVSRKTYIAIRAADVARSTRDWALAARLYGAVLSHRPDLYHIHIQHGHAHKEAGDLRGAEKAYRRAIALLPTARDGVLHLAHTLKLLGEIDEAADLYVSLVLLDLSDDEAMRESRELLSRVTEARRRVLASRLTSMLPPDDIVDHRIDWPAIARCEVVFDASDLLNYFGRTRRPTGIQRVQIETVRHALYRSGGRLGLVGVCCFLDGRDDWIAVPPAAMLRLIDLSVADDQADSRAWHLARDRLHLTLLVAEPMTFRQGAVLVNLGTSWWLQNYFIRIRDVRLRYGVVYIPMIYDVIPVLFPQFCIDNLVQDFIAWLGSVFFHSSKFLAISEATKRDLIAVAARTGVTIEPDDVAVVPLDADFTLASSHVDEPVETATPFVLLVATIEPRKGHLDALRAYKILLDRNGDTLPRMVFVGRNGWRNDRVFSWLADHPEVAARLDVVSDISDARLSLFYRDCQFAIFPSLYEGWGLPVTEALVHGKAVITTTTSSLPEAGGLYACYVSPGDPAALAEQMQILIFDGERRAAIESNIRAQYRPRSWEAIAATIIDEALRLGERARMADPSPASVFPWRAAADRFYWAGRSYAMEWREMGESAEIYRSGPGWCAPDAWGCRVRPDGGMLAFRVAYMDLQAQPVQVTVRLVGSDASSCGYEVKTSEEVARGSLARKEQLSIAIMARADPDGIVTLSLRGSTADASHAADEEPSVQPKPPITTVGLVGFCFTAPASASSPGTR